MILKNSQYAWLLNETAPRHLMEAIKLIGTSEIPGIKNNPTIMGWAKELLIQDIYTNDDTAWCGLFVAITQFRAGREPLHNYGILRAREWANYGIKAEKAELADILVFQRPGGGHVGYYVGEDDTCYHVLGGNQSNTVNIIRIEKSRCIAIRRVNYNSKPENVRTIALSNTGIVSTNEA